MQISILNKKNNKNLIVFMNGWGMDDSVISHLDCFGFDIMTLCDYRNIDFDYLKYDFKKYEKKYLVSWSMGVYVANLYEKFFKDFDKKIAIAGTNKIIDNDFGIPLKIYNYTIKFFSDESAEKFIDNIFLNEENKIQIKRSTKELKDELVAIKNLSMNSELDYDKAIIPNKDIVVPYSNQINYWKDKNVEIVRIDSAHYVFGEFESWQEIIC